MKNKSKIFSYIVLILILVLLQQLIFIELDQAYYGIVDFVGAIFLNYLYMNIYLIILITASLIIIFKSEKLTDWIDFAINGLLIGGGISLIGWFLLGLGKGGAWSAYFYTIYIGYPSLFIGTLVGLVIGLIHGKIKNKNKI